MNVSLEYLERCSAETGFQASVLEKVVCLGTLATEVARHPFLGKVLVLKGGTALNLCFGPPKRLSVDLDFNYIGHVDRNQMLADRPMVEDDVISLAQRSGYRVQRSADAFAGRKLFLSYRSALGQEARIECDLNFLFRVPIAGTDARGLWQPGELEHPQIITVSMEELLIGKILALFDRGAARDAWDVAHLPKAIGDVMKSKRFRAHFVALAAILDHPLSTYTRERLKKQVTERSISEQLAPMLMVGTSPEPKELIEQAWTKISSFLSLAPSEDEYLVATQRGEIKMELLFPNDMDNAKRMAEHPAILWKIHNVREHLMRQRKK